MRSATSYSEWKGAAIIMDDFLGFSGWKKVRDDTFSSNSSFIRPSRKIETRIMTGPLSVRFDDPSIIFAKRMMLAAFSVFWKHA